MSAPAGPPPSGPPPSVPDGWQVSWSDQYNQWFYVQQATGASQWHHPSGPSQPPAPPPPQQPTYYPPPQQPQYGQPQYGQPQNVQNQYGQQRFAPPPNAAQPAASGPGGIMGKLTNLDPKAQMALAAGGGLAAGALLEHEIEGFNRPHFGHHGGHHHMLGTMAGLMGAAGAGALGAKFFGGKSQAAQAPPQQYAAPGAYPNQAPGGQAYPAQGAVAPPPPYPGQQPPSPLPQQPGAPSSGLGLGKFAVGGAAVGAAGALAASGVSNFMHHHQDQGAAAPATGGGGGVGSFFGGLTHSGPRLNIYAATYADKDVTSVVQSRVTPDQVLTIEKMSDEFGDPWPEAGKKMFSVLYQYGDRPLEVWAGSTSDVRVDIRNEPLANTRMAYVNKDDGRIVSLIWGNKNILTKERVDKLENDGDLDCKDLGDGGFYPWETRALICYYKDESGGISIAHAREGGTLRLPWNPLAKWS